ncbi:MAG TPA: hypothetical protein PKU77_07575 [Ferruginibacter sp.]|jgi:hypothetical protein|nr:hypothetical protein [Ferruginibacter sp.]
MLTEKQKYHIAKIINSQLGWTNGWSTSDGNYDTECQKAAERIDKYLRKVLKISSNPSVKRSRPVNQKYKRRILEHAKAVTDYAKML